MATASKAALRERLAASRRQVSDGVRAAEAEMLAHHLEQVVSSAGTVCAYVPVGSEPGSLDLLDVLLRCAGRVLLPVARTGPQQGSDDTPLPLQWGEYQPGHLVTARWGLLEPAEPWLGPSALAEAGLIVLPALAVDRRGVRLGRGRGFYDRSLPARNPRALLVAMVRDEELVDELPSEPHDVPMTHALTPRGGLLALPTRE